MALDVVLMIFGAAFLLGGASGWIGRGPLAGLAGRQARLRIRLFSPIMWISIGAGLLSLGAGSLVSSQLWAYVAAMMVCIVAMLVTVGLYWMTPEWSLPKWLKVEIEQAGGAGIGKGRARLRSAVTPALSIGIVYASAWALRDVSLGQFRLEAFWFRFATDALGGAFVSGLIIAPLIWLRRTSH